MLVLLTKLWWRSSCFKDFNWQIKEEIKTNIRIYTEYQKWLTCDYWFSFRMYIITTLWVCILICWLDKLLWFIFLLLVRMIQLCKYLFQYISKFGLLSVGNINNNFKPVCHLHYRWCTEIMLYCNVMCFVCKCNKMHLSYYWVIILSTCLY